MNSQINNPTVSIICVVFNGEKYLRNCLSAIKNQTYENLEVIVFDNNSKDKTREIVEKEFPQFKLIKYPKNLGMWPGQEEAIKSSRGEIIISVSVDIILDPDFTEKCAHKMTSDKTIGAIQGKIYQYNLAEYASTGELPKKTIDTCGFALRHSRELNNIGHGQDDLGQFSQEAEIFGVEGAVPVFRKKALEDIKVDGNFVDNDYFWYADDFDMAWRMNIFGWKQIFLPSAIAHHDRQTTKSHKTTDWDFIKIRRSVPLFKRRLDYRNTIFTIIKNDFAINILRDFFFIGVRQASLWIYFIVFEPSMILEIFAIIRKLPVMLARRRLIMKRAKITSREFHNKLI